METYALKPGTRITPGMIQTSDPATIILRQLLRIEGEIRLCTSIDELSVLLVNEMRGILSCRQAYYLELKQRAPYVRKISGSSDVDKNAPAVQWLEKELKIRLSMDEWSKVTPVKLEIGPSALDQDGRQFPFGTCLWFPLTPDGMHPIGGVLVANDSVIEERLITIGMRIMSAASHTAKVLAYKSPRERKYPRLRVFGYTALVIGILSLFFPVPMTVLAPMEIVSTNAFVVASPIDGVIENIAVSPNSPVSKGELIIQYVDTVQRNQLELAERSVNVAEARLRQMQQNSFADPSAKRELAQAKAELKLKIADRNFARDNFEKTKVYSPRDGTAVFADRKEWVGKPVVTGQLILEVADINQVEVRANLPVADILDFSSGSRVRIFLDGDPLNPLEGKIYSTSVQAQTIEGHGLIYLVKANLDPSEAIPRLGAHGTAQLFSGKASLFYYLFRRPLTWIRQRTGL